MALSWLRQWMKKNAPSSRRTKRGIGQPHRRDIRLVLESLEDRTLLCASDVLGQVANGLHIFGNAANIYGEVYTLNHGGPGDTPLQGDERNEHIGYLYSNIGNFIGSVVGDIPGSTTKIIGEATTTAGDLGHLASHVAINGFSPTDPETLSDLTALSSDVNALGGGSPATTDYLAGLHDTIDLIGADNWQTALGPAANLVGDAVAEIGDLMGDCADDQPLQVYANSLGVATDFNFAGQVAVFSDPNTARGQALPAGDYSAVIAWGDGSSSSGQIIANAGGSYSIVGTHTYAASGDYPLSVLVAGDGVQGQSQDDATASEDLQTNSEMDAYPDAVLAGQTFNGGLISFQTNALGSQDEQRYSGTINWGDGSTSPGQFAYNNINGRIYVTGSHLYAGPGEYPVSVQVGAPDGSNLSGTTTVSVIPPPLGVSANSVNVSSTSSTYTGPVATFTDTNGDSNPADYSATIYWGDNSLTSAGQIVANGNGTFSVVGTHAYAKPGIYVLGNVNISDAQGYSDTAFDSTVTAGSMSLTANNVTGPAGISFSTTVANFTWPDATAPSSSFLATVSWGDGSLASSAGDQDVQVVANGNGNFSVVATHTYGGSGNYSIHVEVLPPSGDTAMTVDSTAVIGTSSLSVTAQTLSLSPTTNANDSPAGVLPAATTSSGSVNGTVAIFTAPAGASAGDYTATIDWGDGNTSTGQVVANANGTFSVLGSHTYSQIDSYLTAIQVSDNNGNLASAFGTVTPPPPTSSVNPLAAIEPSPTFTVSWSGSDPNGPGIASYSVFVSDNGGTFTPWLTNTTQTSATFTGQAGHGYGFYSVATDQLGIRQPAPIGAQSTTTVLLPQGGGGNSNGGGGTNAPSPPPTPHQPNVPALLALLNQFLPHTETMSADGTTITDNLLGIPLVEMYAFDSGNLVSVTLLGFNIPTFIFSFI